MVLLRPQGQGQGHDYRGLLGKAHNHADKRGFCWTDALPASVSTASWFYACGTAGRDRDHRRACGPAPSRGAGGPGGGASEQLRQQHPADHAGAAKLPRRKEPVPGGHADEWLRFGLGRCPQRTGDLLDATSALGRGARSFHETESDPFAHRFDIFHRFESQ